MKKMLVLLLLITSYAQADNRNFTIAIGTPVSNDVFDVNDANAAKAWEVQRTTEADMNRIDANSLNLPVKVYDADFSVAGDVNGVLFVITAACNMTLCPAEPNVYFNLLVLTSGDVNLLMASGERARLDSTLLDNDEQINIRTGIGKEWAIRSVVDANWIVRED